jgi:hypothetical protein
MSLGQVILRQQCGKALQIGGNRRALLFVTFDHFVELEVLSSIFWKIKNKIQIQ